MKTRYLALGFMLAATSAWSQVEIEKPWMRATVPGSKIAAGYLTVRNKSGTPDRLVGGSSPMAGKVETHTHIKDGDILRMREVKGFDIPAKGRFELKPGGAHLMLVDVKQPFKEGDRIPVTLKFEKAGEVKAEFQVGGLAAMQAPVEHQQHKH
jgi:periplasmic copper chaperone A